MRDYELVFILAPTVEEEQMAGINEGIGSLIQNLKGEMGEVKPWGRRRLAYPINGHKEGGYVEMHFKMDPTAAAELERNLRLNEAIIRHLIVRKGD